MKIQILSSGYNHIDDYVRPFIKSVKEYEPRANLCIVDNGSPDHYPPEIEGVPTYRTDNLAIMTSFNRAINDKYFDWDWLVLSDTDVLCNGKFLKQINAFDPRNIYGMQRFWQNSVTWFDGWLFCISRQIWEQVGNFDPSFMLTGAFQDLDYCIRARNAGFGLYDANLPFKHMEANTTHRSPNFWENREYNRRLIQEKHGLILTRP